MDLHIYTRELLDKHLLLELKEIAQSLGIIPDGNKTRRETWVAALVGQPFPVFQSIELEQATEKSLDVDPVREPLVEAVEASPGVEVDPAREPLVEAVEASPGVEVDPAREPLVEAVEKSPGVEVDPVREPLVEAAEKSPGVEVDPVREPLVEAAEKSLDVDRAQEPIEFPDLESALAEIARLRAQNDKLLELARSQSEIIRKAKDISPVERPSFKRVLALAQAACLNISKALTGGWLLAMGERLKRGFKTLKEIWELLTVDDWHLTDLFCPPPKESVYVAPLFAPIHSKYSAVPFCDDDLIDTWRLGVNAVLSGRSPPAGGEAM